MQTTDFHVVLTFLFVIMHGAQTELGRLRTLFCLQFPLSLQPLEFTRGLAQPTLIEGHLVERHLVVIILNVYLGQFQMVHIPVERFLLLFRFQLLRLFLFRFVTLKGIYDELIVCRTVVRLIEPSLNALNINLGNHQFIG